MTKNKDSKLKAQGKQSKEVDEVDPYEEQVFMDLEEVADSLQISIKKILYYARCDVMEIRYFVTQTYTARLTHPDIQKLTVNPDEQIRIPLTILNILRKNGISIQHPFKPEENRLSMNSLIVTENDFYKLEEKVKQEKGQTTLPQRKSQGTLKDKIPPDTKWANIEMSLTDKECKTLDISVSGGKSFTASCQAMGLESNHSHRPLKAWSVLIAFAIARNNEIPSTGKKLSEFAVKVKGIIPSNGNTLFSHIDRLRKSLKTTFGISEDPIPHSVKKVAYETLFRINDKSYKDEYEQSMQDSKGVKCDHCGESYKSYDHSNVDDEGNYICDNCKSSSHDKLSNQDTFTNYPDDDENN